MWKDDVRGNELIHLHPYIDWIKLFGVISSIMRNYWKVLSYGVNDQIYVFEDSSGCCVGDRQGRPFRRPMW